MELSIVIPALNEEKTIVACVKKAIKATFLLKVDAEVIVADNGSTDSTAQMAREAGARIVEVSEKGYGSALIEGLNAAKGKFLIMADADDSYNFEEIFPFVEKLKGGYDLVMGNRFKGKIEKGAMPWAHRYLGTPVLTAIMNSFFKTKIGDVNCGMRGLSKEAFCQMRLKAAGMEFAQEMIIKASVIGLRICEVPCNLYKDKRGRKPHLHMWRDGWRHLRFSLLFAPSQTFLMPGISLGLLGLVAMILLLVRDFFYPGSAGFINSKHVLSFMLLFLMGMQIIALGLAAHAFSFSQYFDRNSKVVGFLQNYFKLEKGILAGIILVVLSMAIFIYLAVSYYFTNPHYFSDAVRFDFAVFAATFMMVGVQTIFTSFLLSFFYLKIK